MGYTILIDRKGKNLSCQCENGFAIAEFAGFCETCWMNLLDTERAALLGAMDKTPQTIIYRDPETIWSKIFWLVVELGAIYIILRIR